MSPRLKLDEREHILESNRQILLEAAAVEMAHAGYDGANINQISLAAGFAKGTIYNYFSSKKDLMLAVLDNYAEAHFDALASAVRKTDDPRQRLHNLFETGFAFVAQNLAPSRVMVNTIYGPDEDFKNHLYRAYQPMFELVATEILVPGVEMGYFRTLDPMATANLLMTVYLGTASQVGDDGDFLLDPAQVIDFGLYGLTQAGDK